MPANRVSHILTVSVLSLSIMFNLYLLGASKEGGAQPQKSTWVTEKPIILRTKGGLLEVSRIDAPEIFEATRDHRILGIPVAKTLTRVRLRATYRYAIELDREWKIHVRDKTVIVKAPPVQPSLPIGFNTAGMQAESFGVWAPLTGSGEQVQLLKSIGPALADKAVSAPYVEFQRAAARRTVTEFISKWLLTQSEWKHLSGYPVRVFFKDEPIMVLGDLADPPSY